MVRSTKVDTSDSFLGEYVSCNMSIIDVRIWEHVNNLNISAKSLATKFAQERHFLNTGTAF